MPTAFSRSRESLFPETSSHPMLRPLRVSTPTMKKRSSIRPLILFVAFLFLFQVMKRVLDKGGIENAAFLASKERVEANLHRKEAKRSSHFGDVTISDRADWGAVSDPPNFCRDIVQSPQPFRKDCHRDSRNMTCRTAPYETLMFSQFKQDYFLYSRHFVNLKRRGVYLDVATNDPVSISNTYFMDRCLRWKGLCVEANPVYYEKIHRLRSCHIVPTCVGRKDGENVEFALEGGDGAIIGNSNKHSKKWAREKVAVTSIKERCTTMQNLLDRVNIKVVDYLSLDVEGHEVEVLRGFDWSRTKVNVMSIEVSGHILDEVQKLMGRIGYKRLFPKLDDYSHKTGLLQEDVIFLHPDVEFGKPE